MRNAMKFWGSIGSSTTNPSSFHLCRVIVDQCLSSSRAVPVKKFIKLFPSSGSSQTVDNSPAGIGCGGSTGDRNPLEETLETLPDSLPLLVVEELPPLHYQSFPRNTNRCHFPSCKNFPLAFGSQDPPAPKVTPLSYSGQRCSPLLKAQWEKIKALPTRDSTTLVPSRKQCSRTSSWLLFWNLP